MPQLLGNTWDTAGLPTATRTMVEMAVMVVTIGTLGMAVIVTAVGAILTTTRIVIVIPTVVIAATATAIGAGARLLVVIRPILVGAGVIREALPEPVAQLVRQGTLMAPMKAPAGKFAFLLFVYVVLRGHPWFLDERCVGTRLKCCKREAYQCPSPITVSSPSLLSFQSILQ